MLDLLASEWTKLRSVRSTYLALLAASVLSILIGLLVTNADASQWPHKTAAERAGFDPASDSMLGAAIAQLAFGVLGVLAITSEYSTGMIRTSFAAVPRRRALLAGKAAVTGAVTLTTGTVLVFAAFLLGQAVLSPQHLGVSLSSPHAARAVLYACCYLLIVTLLGFGLGAIIRNTAGAITALISLTLLVPSSSAHCRHHGPTGSANTFPTARHARPPRPIQSRERSRQPPRSWPAPPTRPSRSARHCCWSTTGMPDPQRRRPTSDPGFAPPSPTTGVAV